MALMPVSRYVDMCAMNTTDAVSTDLAEFPPPEGCVLWILRNFGRGLAHAEEVNFGKCSLGALNTLHCQHILYDNLLPAQSNRSDETNCGSAVHPADARKYIRVHNTVGQESRVWGRIGVTYASELCNLGLERA